jgi:hypothetical protein
MKRAYLTNGSVNEVNVTDDSIRVDVGTYVYLSGLLGEDYCYLLLGTEIIKVLGYHLDNVLLVQRGMFGTTRRYWPQGTILKYTLTHQEIIDTINYTPLSINATGILKYSNGILARIQQNILGMGGIQVIQSGEVFTIQDANLTAGCAVGVNPPKIPVWLQPYIWDDSADEIVDDTIQNIEYI